MSMRLFEINTRDKIGFIAYLILALAISLFALPLMIAREIYQWKHYNLARFEWEDVIRYGLEIVIISIVRNLLF